MANNTATSDSNPAAVGGDAARFRRFQTGPGLGQALGTIEADVGDDAVFDLVPRPHAPGS